MDKDKLIAELQQLTQNMMGRLYEAEFEDLESFVEERQKLIDDIIRQFSSIPASAAQKSKSNESCSTIQKSPPA